MQASLSNYPVHKRRKRTSSRVIAMYNDGNCSYWVPDTLVRPDYNQVQAPAWMLQRFLNDTSAYFNSNETMASVNGPMQQQAEVTNSHSSDFDMGAIFADFLNYDSYDYCTPNVVTKITVEPTVERIDCLSPHNNPLKEFATRTTVYDHKSITLVSEVTPLVHFRAESNNRSSWKEGVPKKAPRKLCAAIGCSKFARCGGVCTQHGGRRYCNVVGCAKVAQFGKKCTAHGGIKPCSVEGCTKAVQSRGCCKTHGGGVRCRYPGCVKGSISKGFCRGHGGGARCAVTGCMKWAQKSGHCICHFKELQL